ncbi:hypothetical protein K9M48_02195 [Candidatus Gracilibacteria bacterium]|nr:hypothetical protein [Candidatus Gracilibacteria bacterium]
MIILTIIERIFIGFSDRHLLAAITVFNAAIFVLSTDIQVPTQSRVYFKSISYFTTGGYLFTVLIAFTYSIALLGISKNFPFSCESLSSASNQVIETFTKPFKIGMDKANQIKEDTQMFFSSSLGDILTKPNQDNPSYLSQKITNYKSVMIDQVIQDNSSINMGICDYILQEITKRYDKPVFQFSVIVLMYLLFYPFLRIIFWIMSFIGLIIFKLLYLSKVYKIKKIKKEVEEIN